MGTEEYPQNNGKPAERIANIRRKIQEGFYDTSDFKRRLAGILTEKEEITGAWSSAIDDKIIRKALAQDICGSYKDKKTPGRTG